MHTGDKSYRVLVGQLKEKDQLGDQGAGGKIKLYLLLKQLKLSKLVQERAQ
jgi:hypothetical protein